MRQWLGVEVKRMCTKHLMGEHVEHHMFLGTVLKGVRVYGYIRNNLLEPKMLKERHDEIVSEIQARGYKHNTPITESQQEAFLDKLPLEIKEHKIDKDKSSEALLSRCPLCLQGKHK